MSQLSKQIEVNGWQNLSDLLEANGYDRNTAHFMTIANPSDSVTLYVHRGARSEDGLVAAEGMPILEDSYTWLDIDLKNTMLNTASAIDVIFDLNTK